MPESAGMTELFDRPSLMPPLITPSFSTKDHNIGTLLAHRMEELGVKDFFAVPGTCAKIPYVSHHSSLLTTIIER